MKPTPAFGSGLAGALALTLVHEGMKRIYPKAPRMDLLGMTALSKILKSMGKSSPRKNKLFGWTMVGDVLSNSLYYSLAGVGKRKDALFRGAMLGLVAGAGAVLLPKPLQLNEAHTNRTAQTKLLTIGLYLVGGLVAAAVLRNNYKKSQKVNRKYLLKATA